MGLFSKHSDRKQPSGTKADTPSVVSEPWFEYKLSKVWDYDKATEVYALYCYEVTGWYMYVGATGGWVEKGRGGLAWAKRTAKGLEDRLTRGNDLVKENPDDK